MRISRPICAVSVVLLCLGLLWCANWWYVAQKRMGVETAYMGTTLLIYAEDNRRLPSSIDDLYPSGYLVIRDGKSRPGPKALHRPYRPVGDIAYRNLHTMSINPEATEPSGLFVVKGHKAHRGVAAAYSRQIAHLLSLPVHTQPSSPTTAASSSLQVQ